MFGRKSKGTCKVYPPFEVMSTILARVWQEFGADDPRAAIYLALAYQEAAPITSFGDYDSHKARLICNALREAMSAAGQKCDAEPSDITRILLEMRNEDIPLDWAIIDDSNYFFHKRQIEEREHIKSELRDIIGLSACDFARDKASDLLETLREAEEQ